MPVDDVMHKMQRALCISSANIGGCIMLLLRRHKVHRRDGEAFFALLLQAARWKKVLELSAGNHSSKFYLPETGMNGDKLLPLAVNF